MSSKQPRKQRLARYTAPYHRRHREMSSPIDKGLRERQLSRGFMYPRAMPVKKGDRVMIVRGEGKSKSATAISLVDRKARKVYVEGFTYFKSDGTELQRPKFAKYWLYNKKAIASCYNQIDKANGGFTVSAVLREQITKWNSKAQDFQVIQNGYESDRFTSSKAPLGIKNKLGIKGKLAVFVGALGPWHGIDEIISVAKNNPSVSVVVAGGGYGKNLPTLDNLYHIGRLDRDEVPRLLVEADIGLAPYPNLDYGFSPLKIYEYMGCKLPVFATDLPSVREATEGNAFLAKPGNLSSLVSNKIDNGEELNRVANSAYDYATKRRTWDNTIDDTIDLYNKIV